jgi:hypothetical protein
MVFSCTSSYPSRQWHGPKFRPTSSSRIRPTRESFPSSKRRKPEEIVFSAAHVCRSKKKNFFRTSSSPFLPSRARDGGDRAGAGARRDDAPRVSGARGAVGGRGLQGGGAAPAASARGAGGRRCKRGWVERGGGGGLRGRAHGRAAAGGSAPKPPPRPCYLSPLRLPIGVLESGVQLLGAGIRTLLLNNYLLFEVEWTSRGLAHWYPHSVELILVLVVMNPFNFPCLL